MSLRLLDWKIIKRKVWWWRRIEKKSGVASETTAIIFKKKPDNNFKKMFKDSLFIKFKWKTKLYATSCRKKDVALYILDDSKFVCVCVFFQHNLQQLYRHRRRHHDHEQKKKKPKVSWAKFGIKWQEGVNKFSFGCAYSTYHSLSSIEANQSSQ